MTKLIDLTDILSSDLVSKELHRRVAAGKPCDIRINRNPDNFTVLVRMGFEERDPHLKISVIPKGDELLVKLERDPTSTY